jgi:hypothetical protein
MKILATNEFIITFIIQLINGYYVSLVLFKIFENSKNSVKLDLIMSFNFELKSLKPSKNLN